MAARPGYFRTTKKGEIYELKSELNSSKETVQKDAVKKVIAAMTVGKDVSGLFPDVVKCIGTDNLELKKLVYLYVMNYAKSQPDLAILAVNTFVQDSKSPNPLIRALAIRTMGCIRVDRITEYVCEPLRACLKDKDPYVRKTAAIGVAKLADINPQLVEDQGFLEQLSELLSDSNPMVVANAVAALAEIDETSARGIFKLTGKTATKLLNALNECTEWGQVYILNSLAKYEPKDPREAEAIAERVAPRLNHANSAVVLGAVKLLLKYMDFITDKPEFVRGLEKKMSPPLVTMLSKKPEIQYVALRNINIIIQKNPNILQHDIKVFFCKYNDPIYVKLEKLEVMIMLVTDKNIEPVLHEFKEYATEVDVEFVRKAVRSIGRCAIKLEEQAERCIHVLLELIKTGVNYVVQEAIIVIKDIFRKYPNRYESIIATLCENLESLDEPEAKASMIWIIGEYADRISNADELLDTFLETFHDEPAEVQLQLLTATVKLFLKKPKETQDMVQKVLHYCTTESDNPDLRDRGFVYWRLLAADPASAKAVVLAKKPLITDDSGRIEPTLLNELIGHISTLASVYHKPPETFVSKMKGMKKAYGGDEEDDREDEEAEAVDSTSYDEEGAARDAAVAAGTGSSGASSSTGDLGGSTGDLLGIGLGSPATAHPVGSAHAAGPYGAGSGSLLGGPLAGLGVASPGVPTTSAADPLAALGLGSAPAGAYGTSGSAGISGTGSLLGGPISGTASGTGLMSLSGLAASLPSSGPPSGSGGLLGLPGASSAATVGLATPGSAAMFGTGLPAGSAGTSTPPTPKNVLLNADKCKGLEVQLGWARRSGVSYLDLIIVNRSGSPMSEFALQFNKNSFGFAPAPLAIPTLPPGASYPTSVALTTTGPKNDAISDILQVAFKNNIDVFYSQITIPLYGVLTEDGELPKGMFLDSWDKIPSTKERVKSIDGLKTGPDVIRHRLSQFLIFPIAQRKVELQDVMYFSAKTITGEPILAEITFQLGAPLKLATKTNNIAFVPMFESVVESLLRA